MEIASVLLARYYGLVEIGELNRNGIVYFPEVAAALVDRYGFMKYPTKPEDFDENKGIEFIGGRSGKCVIEKLVILNSGIYLDTGIDTAASEALWLELMDWAIEKLGVTFSPDMVQRKAYVSTVTFHTETLMLALHPILQKVAGLATAEVEKHFKRRLEYEPVIASLSADQTAANVATASFTVQRREGAPFGENKYFSTAPV